MPEPHDEPIQLVAPPSVFDVTDLILDLADPPHPLPIVSDTPPMVPPMPSELAGDDGEPIRFWGRGFLAPRVNVQVQDEQVLIRAECDSDPERWADLWLSGVQLGELLVRILKARNEHTEYAVEMIRMLARPMAR